MAVQKSRKSPSKRGMHRSHDFLTKPALSVDRTSGETHVRHRVTPDGFYRGKKVIATVVGAVTTGVVYAVGPLQGLGPADWVQSDLQLAPGNSGGPLADASGTVMGLNTMISGRLALAVTSLAVRRFLRAQDPDGSLGVTLHPVQVSSGGSRRFGLLLVEVAGAGTAAQASLLPGDILVGTDAGPITALQDLEEALDGEGERVVQLHFLRGGRAAVRKASVLLGRARSRAA